MNSEPVLCPPLSAFKLLSWLIVLIGSFQFASPAWTQQSIAPQTTLITTGAVWRYLNDGQDQGTPWRARDFDDTDWPSGFAQLGYGEGDEATVVGYGPDPNAKPITTYFRITFQLPNPKSFQRLTMRLLCDDGAVIYMNGEELIRHNMAYGSHNASSLPLYDVSGPEEGRYIQYGLYSGYLATNKNVLAVEVHQSRPNSEDMSFDLELIGNVPPAIPEVRLTSPVNGGVYEPGTIQVAANATDADGHVFLVRFYSGGTLIGESYGEPFEIDWANVLPGRYLLKAQAFDNGVFRPFSEPVFIQVGEGLPERVTRGPYLQVGTTNSIIVRWRTDWFTSSRVVYGKEPPRFEFNVTGPVDERITEHELQLTGLEPDTKYYYAVGTREQILAGGPDFFFVTAPVIPRPVRIWAIGDAGTTNENQEFVRDVYATFTGEKHTDVWLMLGDNAYEEGTDDQYQGAVFNMYPRVLRQTVLWPTLGNHDDSHFGAADQLAAYYDMFTLPSQGGAGGVASGTERYYSFDYANIHFVCLNSHAVPRTPGSAMLQWLEQDLSMTEKDWIIAYFHHPPYSFGSHDSDKDIEMIQMREHVNPILERHGVDLVLSGHSHNYERSYLLNGHYGYSSNLTAEMILNRGSGSPLSPYYKPVGGLGSGQGTVYIVCGCSGEGHHGSVRRHPAMWAALGGFGSLAIDVTTNQMDVRFCYDFNVVFDYVRIIKGDPTNGLQPRVSINHLLATSQMELRWPTSSKPYQLQNAWSLPLFDEDWVPFNGTPEQTGRTFRVRIGAEMDYRFFRLRPSPKD